MSQTGILFADESQRIYWINFFINPSVAESDIDTLLSEINEFVYRYSLLFKFTSRIVLDAVSRHFEVKVIEPENFKWFSIEVLSPKKLLAEGLAKITQEKFLNKIDLSGVQEVGG